MTSIDSKGSLVIGEGALHQRRANAMAAETAARGVRLRELGVAAMALALLLVIFFNQAFLPGKVLAPTDGIFESPFYQDVAPDGFTAAPNPVLFDQAYQFIPWKRITWEALRSGTIPFWNPYSGTGTPLIGTLQSAVFYPINLALTLIPFESTFVWSAFLRLWIAGFFTFLLMKSYRLRLAPALIAAVSYMLAGFLIVWLGHPHTNAAVWLPALILMIEGYLSAATQRKRLLYLIGMALVTCVVFLGGHIETAVDIVFAAVIYYGVRLVQLRSFHGHSVWQNTTRYLLGPAVAGLLSLALASVQLVPFIEWILGSSVFAGRASEPIQLFKPVFFRNLLSLPVALYPNLFNNPTWDYPYWSFFFNLLNYNEFILYVGTVPFILAIAALLGPKGEHKPLIISWAIVGGVCLGRALLAPGFHLINELPLLRLGHPERLRLIFSFSLSILSGFGLQLMIYGATRVGRTMRRLFLVLCSIALGAGLLLMVGANIATRMFAPDVLAYGRRIVEEEYAKRTVHSNPIEVYYEQVNGMVDGLVAAFQPWNIAMYYPIVWSLAAILIVSVLFRRRMISRTWAAVLLVLLTALDLFLFGSGYNPVTSVENFYPETPVTSALAQDTVGDPLYRTMAIDRDWIPDAHIMADLQDIRSLNYPTSSLAAYNDLIETKIRWLGYGTIFSSSDSDLLRLANLRFVISADRETLEGDPAITAIEQHGSMYIGEIGSVTSRAFMVYDAVAAATDEEAQTLVADGAARLTERLVLSDVEDVRIDDLFSAETTAASHGAGGTVFNVNYSLNSSTWRVNTAEAGLLYVSDSHYPGWKAFVEGVESPILRANIAYRAIPISPGEHTVVMTYAPGWLNLVRALTLAGLVGIGVLTILALLAPRERQTMPSSGYSL